jgi:hypothetical protein
MKSLFKRDRKRLMEAEATLTHHADANRALGVTLV